MKEKINEYLRSENTRYQDAIAYAKGICELVNDDSNPLWKERETQPTRLDKVVYYLKGAYFLDSSCNVIDADIYDVTLTFVLNEDTNKVYVSPLIDVFPTIDGIPAFNYNLASGQISSPALHPNFKEFCIDDDEIIFFDSIKPNPYRFIEIGEKVWWKDPSNVAYSLHTITDIVHDEGDITMVELDNGTETNPYELRPNTL